MLHQYDFSHFFCLVTALNVFVALTMTVLLVRVYQKFRYILVKPSFLLVVWSHIFFQWPMAIYSSYYVDWLEHPAPLFILVHGFVIGGFLLSLATNRRIAQEAWSRLPTNALDVDRKKLLVWIGFVFALSSALIYIYLLYVPFECTGLVALLTNPTSVIYIRELTMKLLNDAPPRYVFSFFSACVAYALFALSLLSALRGRHEKNIFAIVRSFVLIFLCIVAVSLTGVKGNIVKLVIVGAFLAFWMNKASFSLRSLRSYALAIAFSILPALLFNIFFTFNSPNGSSEKITSCMKMLSLDGAICLQTWDSALAASAPMPAATPPSSQLTGTPEVQPAPFEIFGKVTLRVLLQVEETLKRIFLVPFEVGGWYVDYGQRHGSLGFFAIPFVAKVLQKPMIDLPNIIGKTYGPRYYSHAVLPSISAGSGFLFSYYAYIGMWSLPISFAALLLLDFILYIYNKVDRYLFLIFVTIFSVQSMMFLQADFTTTAVTHGVIPLLVLIVVLNFLTCRMKSAMN